MHFEATSDDPGLERALALYESALRDGTREAVIAARSGLCAALVDRGWDPPAEVRWQMDHDTFELRRMGLPHAGPCDAELEVLSLVD
jgi:hypothetical protein